MYVTVFEIARNSNGLWSGAVFDLLVGVGALTLGSIGLVRNWRGRAALVNWIWPLFMLGWGGSWIAMHNFPAVFGHSGRLVDAYRNGHYETVEGTVSVLREQPAHGHTGGDIVVVGGRKFEVNYFLATPAYRQTIAHDGALRAGAHARVYHVGDEIVRVDVKQTR